MYNQYADDIYRFLLVHVKDVQLAEDLTADTFVKAWKNIDKFDFKHSRAWLYKIAQNTMHDYWRKKKTINLDEGFDMVDDKPDHAEIVDKKLEVRQLTRAMSRLPSEMKSVVALRFMQGYSVKETAEALDLSQANVRVIQYRALKKLKGIMS